MKYVDLHVHSLVTDGSMRPEELAAHAAERGLAAFALTDHDNIAGDAAAWQASGQADHMVHMIIGASRFRDELRHQDADAVAAKGHQETDVEDRASPFEVMLG